jgi:capsular polysaccharide biosynthesis protein
MKAPSPVPRVRDYLRILARYWVIIVCVTALSVGAGWVAHRTTKPVYVATSRIFVVAPGSAELYDTYNGHLAAAGHATTIQQLAQNPQVVKRTIDQLGLQQTPAQLIKRIKPVVHDTLVEINVTGDTPELARDTAISVTYNLIALSKEMTDLDKSGTDIVLVDSPSDAYDSRAPLKLYLQLGGALGLALSLLLVIALGRWRDSVLTTEQVARIVDERAIGRNA